MTAKTEKQGEREKTLFLHIRVKAVGWTDNYSSAFTLCTLQEHIKRFHYLGHNSHRVYGNPASLTARQRNENCCTGLDVKYSDFA
jgi:hypothetical protein